MKIVKSDKLETCVVCYNKSMRTYHFIGESLEVDMVVCLKCLKEKINGVQ